MVEIPRLSHMDMVVPRGDWRRRVRLVRRVIIVALTVACVGFIGQAIKTGKLTAPLFHYSAPVAGDVRNGLLGLARCRVAN